MKWPVIGTEAGVFWMGNEVLHVCVVGLDEFDDLLTIHQYCFSASLWLDFEHSNEQVWGRLPATAVGMEEKLWSLGKLIHSPSILSSTWPASTNLLNCILFPSVPERIEYYSRLSRYRPHFEVLQLGPVARLVWSGFARHIHGWRRRLVQHMSHEWSQHPWCDGTEGLAGHQSLITLLEFLLWKNAP